MKKPILVLLLLAATTAAGAQQTKIIPSKATEATLYFNGAEMVHTATAQLVRGENVLTVEGLSPTIDPASLKIRTTNGAVVASSEFSIDYLSRAKAAAPRIDRLTDSIARTRGELQKVDIARAINANTLGFLRTGTEKNVSGSESGLGVDELVKTMDYYQTKALELETRGAEYEKQREELSAVLSRLQKQLDQESVQGSKRSGVLKLTLSAPAAGNTELTIRYFTAAAAWSPYYEVNIARADDPVRFALRANVRQTTGLDWERVKLTLSTATPSGGKAAPLFSTWFLSAVRPMPVFAAEAPMQNSYVYAEEMALDEVVAVGYGTSRKQPAAAAPALPLYSVNGEPVAAEYFNALDPNMILSRETLTDPQTGRLTHAVTLKISMDDFVTTAENDLNRVFTIDLPYTIPGNGKTLSIDLQSVQTPAEYKYYAAPKLDGEVFLLAEVADWQKLGLLGAPARVSYDGTYIGETRIDASSTEPRLTLTLGADRRVAVEREKLQDFSSTRTLGSNTEQTFTYRITVKNNRNTPVRLTVKDQYPRSTDKAIEVTLDTRATTPWTARVEETGVITWEAELAAGETKEYRLSYTVRYPKELRLNL